MAVSNESVSKNSASPSLLLCGKQLSPEWTAISITDQRIYFVNQRTRSSHWFPPPEFWTSKLGLPYGWEAALDDHNKKYYINHVTRATTREDPRSEADQANHLNMTPPQSRRIEVVRDAKIGFGFVAGSEKPVVIRSVIPNGPSHDKLFANDQILKVNGTDVRSAAQADVISLIKSAVGRIELEVVATEDVQDSKNQRNRKSSLMSRTTRERRRSTPVSVRFADEPALVQVIGPTEPVRRSSVPLIPNVLKVFLENGQTRSFRYDSNTTAEEIFSSFSSKLDVKLMEHFSLVLSGPKKGQISYIQNNEKISEIYTNRNCSSVNCICKLIIAFVPKDHFELLSEDPNTFEYLYAQVSNRVVEGFYGMDLKYDLAIKLAALQIQQKAMEAAAGRPVKISVRQVEKEFGGLAKFVMSDLLNNTKEKELRKILDQQIKQNENLASPGERYMSSLQCKLHYLNLAVEMFSYGGRYFDAKLLDNGSEGPSLKKTKKQHITVLINLKYGVSQVIRGKVNVLCQLAELHEITGFSIRRDEDNKRLLQIKLQEGKKIQLICSTVDCLDMIALITGYYKVYVDNTTNTPLPVENEERWPFTFQRSPPVNDAPDYYSRHRVVPDVWSYPSHFQISNTKRKPQVENFKPLSDHKDVYIDLSSAPPRYTSNETAISEESEDDVVADKTSQRQKVEIEIAHGQKSRKYDALVTQTPHSSRGDLTHMQEDDNTGLVLSDEDHELLETASSFLKSRPEDNITDETELDFSYDSEIAADSEELLASRKQPHVLSEGHGEENVALKSSKTELAETMEENQDDLISELILAEELWQEENAGVSVIDAGNKPVERVSTDSGDSFVAVERKSDERSCQTNNSIREQRWLNDVGEIPGEVSTNTENFQFEDGEKGIVSGNVDENDLRAYLDSSNHSLGTTDVNQNVLIDCSTTKIASLADDSGSESPAFSTVEGYLNLDLSSEHDPFIRTDPFQDRSPSPSPRDLGFDESKFDNKGIELVDFQENEASQELHEQESAVSILGKCVGNDRNGSDDSDENERKSPETFNSFDELKLKVDSSLIGNGFSDGTEGVNEDNFEDALDSHLISLEFSEGSETETESAMSDDGESLWSTFPEYFQPSGRLTYSSNKSANLSLAEEDQYEDVVNSPEADREVALVSVKELNVRDESNSNSFVDISARKNGISLLDDCDELSTASSESFEYTYEVNAEIPSESEEMSEDSGYVNFKENNKRSTEGIYNKVEETSSFSSHSSVDVCLTDECDISSGNYSNFNDKASKVNALTALFSTNTKSTSHFDQCSEGQFLEKNDLTEMSKESEVSSLLRDAPLKRAVVGSTEVISTERFSLRESDDKRMLIDRSYSPSDWIMPSPPTPTPELQDDDIPIVSPPPVSPTPVEDKLDEELRRLIVPPPPSSVDILPMVSGIRIASPPPLNFSDNELDRLMYDYDDIRFLSLTDDHKLAKTNGLVSTRNVDSNFTEDRKIQAQKVAVDPPMIRKQSIAVSSRDESNFNSLENPSNGNHCLIKDNSSTFTSHLFESRCWPNPSVCDSSTLFDSNTTCKDGRILGDFRSKDVVKGLDNPEVITRNDGRLKKTAELSSISGKNNQDIIERGTRFPSKQKPPIPPKPRMFRSTSGEGNVGSAKHPLENAMGKPTYGVPKSSSARHSVDKLAKSHSDSSSVKNTDTSNETSSNSVYHSFRRVFATDNPPITEQSHKASSPETFVPNSPSSTNSKDSPSRNEINPQADKRGTRRSLSFTCRSPYVPAPYSSSLTQSLNSAPSSAETLHKSTLCNNSNSSAENPTETIETDCFNITRSFGTQTFPSSANSTTASSKELLFHQELRPSMRQPASDLSCKNSINNLNRVLSEDGTNRTFPKQPTDSSNLQHRTSELQHDICNNSLTPPPLPDSPPPPLPSSSPPKIIPQFDLEDFDFGEPLIETFYDNTPSVNVESNTSLDLPSFTKDLKSTHSLESQNESRSSCPERREKLYGGSTLFRSLTLTSFPRDINRRSLSEDWSCHRDAGFPSSPIKRSSFPFDESPDLDDIATNSIHHLEEFQVKAFRVKCSHVCEDGLLKVGVLKNRLEMCLNKSVSNPQTTGEKKNWLLIFQNNARFLACDIKVISSSVKRGSPQVVSALKTSLDSLEKLVESCENTYSVLNDTCDRNGRTLVAMVSEVLEQYRDVICTVKAASGQQADSPDVEALVKKSNAVAALISSLIRTLRRY